MVALISRQAAVSLVRQHAVFVGGAAAPTGSNPKPSIFILFSAKYWHHCTSHHIRLVLFFV